MKLVSFSMIGAGALLALGACGSDDEDTPTDTHQVPAECEPIIDACHHVDDGTAGPAHDCHENAHEVWSAAECTTNAASCIAACEALEADSGSGGSAGAGQGGQGGAHDH